MSETSATERASPTPEFDRKDVMYECGRCGEIVDPKNGDMQAGIVIGGGTWKLCAECAREIRDEVMP